MRSWRNLWKGTICFAGKTGSKGFLVSHSEKRTEIRDFSCAADRELREMKSPVVAGTDASLVQHCYSESRPNYVPPSSPEALLAGRVPLFRRRYLPLLPIDRQAAILEIGCGCGEFLY